MIKTYYCLFSAILLFLPSCKKKNDCGDSCRVLSVTDVENNGQSSQEIYTYNTAGQLTAVNGTFGHWEYRYSLPNFERLSFNSSGRLVRHTKGILNSYGAMVSAVDSSGSGVDSISIVYDADNRIISTHTFRSGGPFDYTFYNNNGVTDSVVVSQLGTELYRIYTKYTTNNNTIGFNPFYMEIWADQFSKFSGTPPSLLPLSLSYNTSTIINYTYNFDDCKLVSFSEALAPANTEHQLNLSCK